MERRAIGCQFADACRAVRVEAGDEGAAVRIDLRERDCGTRWRKRPSVLPDRSKLIGRRVNTRAVERDTFSTGDLRLAADGESDVTIGQPSRIAGNTLAIEARCVQNHIALQIACRMQDGCGVLPWIADVDRAACEVQRAGYRGQCHMRAVFCVDRLAVAVNSGC